MYNFYILLRKMDAGTEVTNSVPALQSHRLKTDMRSPPFPDTIGHHSGRLFLSSSVVHG